VNADFLLFRKGFGPNYFDNGLYEMLEIIFCNAFNFVNILALL